MSGTRVVRLVLLVIVTAGLAGAAWWFILGPKSPAQLLQSGESAYEAGTRALQEKNGAVAKLRFQEARIMAANALERIEAETKSGKKAGKEQMQEWTVQSGNALYLKAKALRDEAAAKNLEDGKEVIEILDTSTGAKFRPYFASIPDPKARDEAITALRNAAARLPKDAELQTDALRSEIMLPPPMAWSLVHRFASSLLEIKPDDTRARYFLAKHEFEQPQIGINQLTGPPKAPEKRARTRVLDSLAQVAKIKESKDYPLGRTLFLEAQIHQWLMADHNSRGETEKAQKEREKYEAILFDERTGALGRFKSGEGLKNLSKLDLDGIVGLHLMGLDLVAEQQRKRGNALGKVKATLADTIAICEELSKANPGAFSLDDVNGSLVVALAKTQSVLSTDAGKEWRDTLEFTRKSLRKSLEKDLVSSQVIAEFSALLQREAVVASKAGEEERAKNLRKEARTWVDDTLANLDKRKASAQALELHVLAAEMKFASDGKREEIEPHVKVLRDSKIPQVQGIARLIQGVVYEREGRLEKAKQQLEEVVALGNSELKLRANMALTNVYLGLGMPDKALESLEVVEKVYEGYDDLSPQEKLWAQHFLRSPEDMLVLQIVANLETAKQKVTEFRRDKPDLPVPADRFDKYERAVAKALLKLPREKRHSLTARQALINYFAFSGRLSQAEKELASAKSEHPNSVALMQLDVALLVRQAREKSGTKTDKELEKELKVSIDDRVQKFIEKFPEDRAARLYWVSWLSRSGRNDQALEYLKSPANFPGVKDTTYHRLLASLLVAKGDTKEASKVLQQMPQDPLIDAMLIQIADAGQAKQKSVQEAMTRYVSNGLFRIWNAELAFQEKRYIDAADLYFKTFDYTQVKELARAGLQRSLIALAGEKPADARNVIGVMLTDHPHEPALLLPYAIACLNLDDIGTVEDNWETHKTMASALNAWEQAVLKTNPNRAATTLAKAELWTRSNDPKTAHLEVMRALEHAPNNPTALSLIIRLDINLGRLADARKHLAELKKAEPNTPSTIVLEAQVENADGKTAQAIDLLEPMLAKNPKHSGAYNFLVSLLARDKQSAKAIKWSEKWMEELPEDLDAAQNLVAQLTMWKKEADAKKKATEFTAFALKEISKQLEERKFAEEKEPEKKRKELLNEARWLLEMRFAQSFLRGEDLDEAERRLNGILKEKPDAAGVYMVLGEIHLARKDWKAASQAYHKVIELDKGNFIAGNNLAWVLATQMNQPEKALEMIREISKGHFSQKTLPGDRLHPEVLDTLGTVYLKLDRPELHKEMSQTFAAAIKRYPRDPRMYLYQGHALAGIEDFRNAINMYTSAIELANQKEGTISQAQRESVIRDAEAARKKLQRK